MQGAQVFVGLSGGVDSAVTAALLARAGARVTGVFIKGWYPPGMPCTWAADRRDAMRVAAHLGIRFETLDASAEYKRGVIDYILAEYRAGRTPNPDVMCNREVKFGAFYRYLRDRGGDTLATGHYAESAAGRLYRGRDAAKDQSYFLWAVPHEALVRTLFPLGERVKEEVRAEAARLALPVASKRDSQGICFLGGITVADFLRAEFGEAPGHAIDREGREIGWHDGVLLYTLGERVPLRGAPGPWYVRAKDVAANTLTVSRERAPEQPAAPIAFSSANWLGDPVAVSSAQCRYHGPEIPGCIVSGAFRPDEPLPEPVTPGQSIVFYAGAELLGGGIIGE
jgi:tRNA-specific 2-thiouridylase